MTVPTYDDWMALSRTEYDRLLALLRGLDDEQWYADTVCPGWRVREMVAHLVGAGESNASIREAVRQTRLGRGLAQGRDLVDGINDVQVRERTELSPTQLVDALAEVAPRALRGRARVPRALRAVQVPFGPPVGTASVGYLMGRIYTRDLWMHRLDIAAATGTTPLLTADHDGVLVADVVAEWAGRHGTPYRLELTGPAGGTFASPDAPDDAIVLDTEQFVASASGREPAVPPFAMTVPF